MITNKMAGKFFTKRNILCMMLIIILIAGVFFGFHSIYAASIDKTRGYITVDLDEFVLVESSSNDKSKFGLNAKNDDHSEFNFHYKNSFTDRNNIGCTYRTSSPYDMTDVNRMWIYAYSRDSDVDKIMFYINPSSNKYFHRMDFEDVKDSLVNGSGKVYSVVEFYRTMFNKEYRSLSTHIDRRYGSEYVYLGMSHSWADRNAEIFLCNKEIKGDTQGSICLQLFPHPIQLLEPDKVKQVQADGSTQDVSAAINLTLGTEGGKIEVGEEGIVYRGENLTLNYTLKNANDYKLVGYEFYTHKDDEEPIYTMNIEGGETSSTINFSSDLIKKLEEHGTVGEYNLGEIYIKPIFKPRAVTFDFNSVVLENENVYVAEGTQEGTYQLKEKNGAVIGTFTKNKAENIEDVLTVDYTPNSNYTGNYEFSYYEIRECEAANQVNTTEWARAYYNEDKYDIENKYTKAYFWLRAHISRLMQVELSDKTVTFNNKPVSIDTAKVMWNGNEENVDSNQIRYEYYTNENCTQESLMKELPINAGTYYVKAILKANPEEGYNSSESNIAKITIKKATPTLSNVRATEITYGQKLSECKQITGTATGVTNSSHVEGQFNWVNGDAILNAGTNREDVIFTPSAQYSLNYTEAYGKATINVNQATPNITVGNKTETFSGEHIAMDTAVVTGIDGKPTGQKIKYEYYTNQNCNKKLSKEPVNAGTYYVLASVDPSGNYAWAKSPKSEAGKLIIDPRESKLVPVPIPENKEYRIYATNLASILPEGSISLKIDVDGVTEKEKRNIKINSQGYAACTYSDMNIDITQESTCGIIAEYVPTSSGKDNYEIEGSRLEIGTSDDVTVAKHAKTKIKYGSSNVTYDFGKEFFGQDGVPDGTEFKWNIPENDVAELTHTGNNPNSGKIDIKTKNAGTAMATAYVKVPAKGSEEAYSFYAVVEFEVTKADWDIIIEKSTLTYNGLPQNYIVKKKQFNGTTQAVDTIPADDAVITYKKGDEVLDDLPIDAGTYSMEVKIPANRNYNETVKKDTLVIDPAIPEIKLDNKTVTYDSKAKPINPPKLIGVPDGTEVTGQVSYTYEGINGTSYDKSSKTPVNAGQYQVTATVAAEGNYKSSSDTSNLIIKKADCTVLVKSQTTRYTGKAIEAEVTVEGADGEKNLPVANVYYRELGNDQAIEKQEPPVDTGVYLVRAETAGNENYNAAESSKGVIVIARNNMTIHVEDTQKTYTGDPVSLDQQSTKLKVTGVVGTDITGDVPVEYEYYKDSQGNEKLNEAPVNAGTYYFSAKADKQRNYYGSKSNIAKLTIKKARPKITAQAGNITYGQYGVESVITGEAKGIKDESLQGTFVMKDKIETSRPNAGQYSVNVLFTPSGESSENYTDEETSTTLNVNKYTPVIEGKNKSETYTGEVIKLDDVTVLGANGMPEPDGMVMYKYFSDSAMTSEVTDVINVGTYYVKVQAAETDNYNQAIENYQIVINKADAAIVMVVTDIDRNNKVTVKGLLPGVFDEPTGKIKLYKRISATENTPAGNYEEAGEAQIVKNGQWYQFECTFALETNKTYDFKAEYNHGEKDNYNVTDGQLLEIDTSKDVPHIEFEKSVYDSFYGQDDFNLNAKDLSTGNSDDIIYRQIEKAGKPQSVTIGEDGNVNIKDVGTSYVMAFKSGKGNYLPTLDIAQINIAKAPVEISVENKVKVYDGEETPINEPKLTSFGKAFDESNKLKISYEYSLVKTGEKIEGIPVDAGLYHVDVNVKGNDHYESASSEKPAKLTIKKADAQLNINIDNKDEKNRNVHISGSVDGAFDNPTGTVTLFIKESTKADSQYSEVLKDTTITENDGEYLFEGTLKLDAGKDYDIKAGYVPGVKDNYNVKEAVISKVKISLPSGNVATDDKMFMAGAIALMILSIGGIIAISSRLRSTKGGKA